MTNGSALGREPETVPDWFWWVKPGLLVSLSPCLLVSSGGPNLTAGATGGLDSQVGVDLDSRPGLDIVSGEEWVKVGRGGKAAPPRAKVPVPKPNGNRSGERNRSDAINRYLFSDP
jgi:hypothetical protein